MLGTRGLTPFQLRRWGLRGEFTAIEDIEDGANTWFLAALELAWRA
jgi:hypothetical protein